MKNESTEFIIILPVTFVNFVTFYRNIKCSIFKNCVPLKVLLLRDTNTYILFTIYRSVLRILSNNSDGIFTKESKTSTM